MEHRNALLELALKFHANYSLVCFLFKSSNNIIFQYQKQANDWITSAGSIQPDIMSMNEEQLINTSTELQAFKEQWEAIYSEVRFKGYKV
jgi:hypothetical protein